MTDELRGGGPGGPPWSVDLLADLHAGVLDAEQSARLWPRVNADPAAKAVIEALDSVKVGLGELGNAPVAPMPATFAARLDAALDAEARQAFGHPVAVREPLPEIAPVIDLSAARGRRGKRAAWGAGLLTAAAAAVAVGFAVLPGTQQTGGVAEPAPTAVLPPSDNSGQEGPLAVKSTELAGVPNKVVNRFDYGPLKDRAGVDRCRAENKLDPAKNQVVGVRPVTLDGKPGTMILQLDGIAKFRVLVVEPDCAALFNGTIG
ncbi:hypothetical protein [Actinokineospora sp. NBRC 105648]|uniref:hypothetical protein n=1 Tax=Actinokineospora sp. NBRC 105648 TaxID=3032206 RepID=UPI00249FAA7D|nr:hypothetical protein [Actinokineospora sp. NBRC 105648]GLZ37401.1 hypothetical protein Acsp05_10260 [Actinokineospora sp. NBRC 105648]